MREQLALAFLRDPVGQQHDPVLQPVLRHQRLQQLQVHGGVRMPGDHQPSPTPDVVHALNEQPLALDVGDATRTEDIVAKALAPVAVEQAQRWVEQKPQPERR